MPFFVGIDIGSSWTKGVLLKEGRVLARKALSTGPDFKGAGFKVLYGLLSEKDVKIEEVVGIVVTGYGRDTFPWGEKVTELSCHAKGVSRLRPSVRTVIDVGGQDAKVLRVNHGRLLGFVMNDRCAAGTGRFLEAMARIFKVKPSKLGTLAKRARRTCVINSTCAVFAETEVVSLLASGCPKEAVARGIIKSVCKRISSLAHGFGLEGEVALVGGVAKIPFFKEALQEELGVELIPLPFDPRFTGALGAALIAEEKGGGRCQR